MKLIILDKTESTNDCVAAYKDCGEDTAVFAYEQTGGRGSKGRSFSSPRGGIYLSFVKHYYGLKAENAYEVTKGISVAVALTLRAYGVKAEIKWPNDIFVGGKKICGMLTENKIENGFVRYTICGVGININNDLPDELKGIAVSAKEILGKPLDLFAVLNTLIYNIEHAADKSLYPKLSCVIGRRVLIAEPRKDAYEATVEEILADGRLKTASGEVLANAEIKLI